MNEFLQFVVLRSLPCFVDARTQVWRFVRRMHGIEYQRQEVPTKGFITLYNSSRGMDNRCYIVPMPDSNLDTGP